jgi:hypothetical protein
MLVLLVPADDHLVHVLPPHLMEKVRELSTYIISKFFQGAP